MNYPKLHIAIPLMDEDKNLSSLLHCIRNQTYKNFMVWIVVNQPEDYWLLPEKKSICIHNATTINRLNQVEDFDIKVMDYASKDRGWKGKNIGVGMARKTVMDAINCIATPKDIIICLDGDTSFGANYFQSIADNFAENPGVPAISIPYYHPLTGVQIIDRAMLHYEIYMRYYRLNLSRIGSLYNFTALGSAMACTVETYRKVGGMTPKKSGEDFYFLQKVSKYKPLKLWNEEKVFPGSRFSDRVFFGTGPALIKGASGNWDSYPIYKMHFFHQIAQFFNQFNDLYTTDIPNIGDGIFGQGWTNNLRKNSTTTAVFVRACQHKFDGLRTLQFLKQQNEAYPSKDEDNFIEFINTYYDDLFTHELVQNFSFINSAVETLNEIRNILVKIDDDDLKMSQV